jgi:hypothetical protein
MATTKRRYPKEEMRKRGEAIFAKTIMAKVKGRDRQDYVVIDIETGDFEVDADNLRACQRLRERIPDAQIWARRVGSRYLHHIWQAAQNGHVLRGRNV